MPNSLDHDLRRAKDIRKQAQGVKDPVAKAKLLEASDRLERRAAKKAGKIGRSAKRGQQRTSRIPG